MQNIHRTIFLLALLLVCSASRLATAQSNPPHKLSQEGSSSDNQQTTAPTSIAERLRAGILCIGIALLLSIINKSFYADFYRLNTEGKPDSPLSGEDMLNCVLINLLITPIWLIAFGISIGQLKKSKRKNRKPRRFFFYNQLPT